MRLKLPAIKVSGCHPIPVIRQPVAAAAAFADNSTRTANAATASVNRAIQPQHQAAIDAGELLPPRPSKVGGPPSPEAKKILERLQRDSYLLELNLEQNKPQAGMPEPAQPQPAPEHEAKPEPEVNISEGELHVSVAGLGADLRHWRWRKARCPGNSVGHPSRILRHTLQGP